MLRFERGEHVLMNERAYFHTNSTDKALWRRLRCRTVSLRNMMFRPNCLVQKSAVGL